MTPANFSAFIGPAGRTARLWEAKLIAAIKEGRIDGSVYSGRCACLVGTLANARKCDSHRIPGLTPNSSRPAEMFFLNISPGDTPDKNVFAKLVLEWCEHWLANMRAAFPRGIVVTFS